MGLPHRFHSLVVPGLLGLGLALRLLFAGLTPAWEAPDEYPHYWVAEYIVEHGALPQSAPDFPRYEAYQPPLYYAVAAGVQGLLGAPLPYPATPGLPPGGLVALRLLSVLCGFLTLVVVWHALRDLDGLRERERWAALMVMAVLPTFVGLTSAVNNDGLVVLLGALTLREVLRPQFGGREGLRGGVWAGLGLLTKMNAVVLVPLLMARGWQAGRWGQRWRTVGASLLGVGAGALLLLSRNLALYGDVLALTPGIEQAPAPSLALVGWALQTLFWSFWVAFGRFYEVHWPAWAYLVLLGPLVVLAVWGWMRNHRPRPGRILFLGTIGVGVGLAASLYFTLTYPEGTQTSWGKNLYPVLPLIALFLGVGWSRLGERAGPAVTLGAGGLLLAGCGWGLWMVAP